ncbi:hypothetical protein LTR85_009631 [Meristemomyces frigidus]|nr:hypothetical protein LTR85_009631 [Meristemomyces frigidus]
MNGSVGSDGDGGLKSFYGYKETFGEGVVWVDIPRDLKFVHTKPYDDDYGEEDATGGDEVSGQAGYALAALAQTATRQEDGRRTLDTQLEHVTFGQYATHGLEALSAVASQDPYNNFQIPPPVTGHVEQAPSNHSASPQHTTVTPSQHSNLDFILNPAAAITPAESNIDPSLNVVTRVNSGQAPPPQTPQQHSASHVRTSPYTFAFGRPRLLSKGSHYRRPAIDDPGLAFLLRDFSERAGLWMDLFDLDRFFSQKVPVLAIRCPLLLYSCVALSAKSLARVEGRKSVIGGQITPSRQSKMELWPDLSLDVEGWVRKAREYYDLAVSLLRQALAGASRPPTSSLPEDASPETVAAAQGVPLPNTDSDELVAATAILCIYEFLDASGPEWSRHLDGAKSLFDIAKDRMVPLTLPPSPVSVVQQVTQRLARHTDADLAPPRGLSQGRKAVFWNFVRQDMLSAFINNASTRLDTSDLPMWRSAGLKLTPEGYVCPSDPQHPQYSKDNAMSDDIVCNALIWLLMKLVNCIAAGDDLPEAMSPLGHGVRQQELLEYWEGMDEQFRVWYEGLPESFHPTAVRRANVTGGAEEKWFPRPMCASTMQSYHFARIQLLHNKPHTSTAGPASFWHAVGAHARSGTSLAARHASYASILQQSRTHAKEIVAIGLGRSDEGTRIHSVQPLWTAGLVLGISEDDEVDEETESWRRSILSLLRGIESDMGWASEYRVQSLLELWHLPPDWGLGEEQQQ